MTKFKSIRLAVIASAIIGSGASVPPAQAQAGPYEQCLMTYCFGHYPNDPVGYNKCVRHCADLYPPQ